MTSTALSMLELLKAVDLYFQGEKIEALVFILPIGLLSLVFSVWLFTDEPGAFAKGVAIPFLLMGLLMTTVGGVVGYRTPGQVAQLQQGLQTDPQAALAVESQRMQKVNAAWSKYLVLWGLMGVLGLGLRFATSGGFSQGLGIALVLFAGVGLMVDGFAERRAHAYESILQDVAASSSEAVRPASR
jgi:hypothetical protein